MKNYFFVALSGLFILGCNNAGETNSTSKDSMSSMHNSNMEKPSMNSMDSVNKTSSTMSNPNTPTASNDFVNNAGAGGMMEVEMGKLAQTNGGSEDVKSFGKMLEKDHTDANNKLKEIASQENINMPSSMLPEQKEHVDKLQMLKDKEFDKVFIPMMIEDHTKDIAEFKKAATTNDNEKIKTFATATLPTLENHLAKAKSIYGVKH